MGHVRAGVWTQQFTVELFQRQTVLSVSNQWESVPGDPPGTLSFKLHGASVSVCVDVVLSTKPCKCFLCLRVIQSTSSCATP